MTHIGVFDRISGVILNMQALLCVVAICMLMRASSLRIPGNSKRSVVSPSKQKFDPLGLSEVEAKPRSLSAGVAQATAAMAFSPLAANAAGLDIANTDAIPSALAAYGHYLGLVLVVGSLTTERMLTKPGMAWEQEEKVATADIVYGLSGILVLYTGYLRVTQYGKGWDFYAHSPVFWVKLALLGVMGAASLFPTIKIIQRAVDNKNGVDVPPLSPKLANRMTKIMNGELLAVVSIPLAASLMARGVGYSNELPWQAGAALVALPTVGLSVKYVKEALSWTEDEDDGAGFEAISSSS